jgi:YVTN family beta-propeller protein
MGKRTCGVLLLGTALAGCLALTGRTSPISDKTAVKTELRRPVALALAEGDRWLFTANQRSGSITAIDTTTRQPVAEAHVGRRLADLAVTPEGRLLAVDEAADELILLSRKGPDLEVAQRLKVSATPVSVRVAPDGRSCTVASLWSRRLTLVDLDGDRKLAAVKSVELPFAPRHQLPLPGGNKLVVADSFGGRLAAVDLGRGAVESVRTLPGHNIRGVALRGDGSRLLLAHQVLNPQATTSFDDIHWGNLLTNNLRSLAVKDVADPEADLLRGSDLHYLGDVGRGAADPSGLAVLADGRVLLTLGGVGELAVGRERGGDWQRLAVGARPTAVVASADGTHAYVANTFADSVSVVDLKAGAVRAEIKLGPQPPLARSDRGELLFHDARLTHDRWFSCQSCHTDGHTNGLLNDNLSDGSYGTPKRVLSLLGVGDTAPYGWNGRFADLESQIRQTIETTMRGRPLTAEQVGDLAAYLRTLPPPPALAKVAGAADAQTVDRGRQLFAREGCAACHQPPGFTSAKTYRVGEANDPLLNPPSLRGVGQGGPYFHDNRAASLAEVFTRHRHQVRNGLEQRELDDLLSYLRTL